MKGGSGRVKLMALGEEEATEVKAGEVSKVNFHLMRKYGKI
ncbi:MAG: hypothetical protein ACQESB_01100 [Elusimicrobiota bacterium]